MSAVDDAIGCINAALGIQAIVTIRGDEVKCWTPDGENGQLQKTYLDEVDLHRLAEAFGTLALALERQSVEKPDE